MKYFLELLKFEFFETAIYLYIFTASVPEWNQIKVWLVFNWSNLVFLLLQNDKFYDFSMENAHERRFNPAAPERN